METQPTTVHCRSCGSARCTFVLDLGQQPLANNLLREAELEKSEPAFPLRLCVCEECWLMQIADTVPPTDLFTDYIYFSSWSETMLKHAEKAAASYISEFNLTSKGQVIEVASNDGYFLQNFTQAGIPCFGIEPAVNIAKVARTKGISTIEAFFGRKLAHVLDETGHQADLIAGSNVFAHAPDIHDFMGGLAMLLKPDGRIVLEFPYGAEMIEKTEFDTIYHEHVFYFTITPLTPLFARHGLEIFRVERLPIHGGSLRLYAAKEGRYPVEDSVTGLLREEAGKSINSLSYYERFSAQVRGIKESLTSLLRTLKAEGRSIAAYGASAKGSTLLNFCGIGRDVIDFVADRSSYKQGHYTPGTHLPIVRPDVLGLEKPDYTLLLTWNFAEEILRQQTAYRMQGGRFIIPVPEVTVV
jgi:SAM-dependent methyltransferase